MCAFLIYSTLVITPTLCSVCSLFASTVCSHLSRPSDCQSKGLLHGWHWSAIYSTIYNLALHRSFAPFHLPWIWKALSVHTGFYKPVCALILLWTGNPGANVFPCIWYCNMGKRITYYASVGLYYIFLGLLCIHLQKNLKYVPLLPVSNNYNLIHFFVCIVKNAEHPQVSAQANTISGSSLHFYWFIIWLTEWLKIALSVADAAGCALPVVQLVFWRVRLVSRKMFQGALKEAICLAS